MQKNGYPVLAVAAVLVVFLVVTAGCLSIPGPEPRPTATPAKQPATTAATPPVKTVAVTTVVTQPTATAPVPLTTVQVNPRVAGQGAYETRTCAEQGGALARPGQTCPGTWLAATDTFSCCSVMPVSAINRTTVMETGPLNLIIVMNDDPGSIIPS